MPRQRFVHDSPPVVRPDPERIHEALALLEAMREGQRRAAESGEAPDEETREAQRALGALFAEHPHVQALCERVRVLRHEIALRVARAGREGRKPDAGTRALQRELAALTAPPTRPTGFDPFD